MNNKLSAFFIELGMEYDDARVVSWIVIVLGIILLFYFNSLFCRKVLIPLVRKLTAKTSTRWDDILLNLNVLNNFCNLIPAVIMTALLPFIMGTVSVVYTFSMKICWVYIVVIGVKLVCSMLSALYVISNESEKTKNHTLQGVFQMLKLTTICIGGIIIISTLIDWNPVEILAGLGASAAVLMLVFKDSIMGLVAGIQLSANDMLRPGDWITIPKHGADGVIVDVTLTTVKVQNWDNTIITVPPYALVSDSFQNWRGMKNSGGRRIKRSIFIDMNTVTLCTPELLKRLQQRGWITGVEETDMPEVNLTLFRKWLEEWLRNHSSVKSGMMVMVRQLQPTSEGLPLELYFFFDGTEWVSYEHLQSEIFEYVFAVLPEFGLRVFQRPAGSDLSANFGRIPRHLY